VCEESSRAFVNHLVRVVYRLFPVAHPNLRAAPLPSPLTAAPHPFFQGFASRPPASIHERATPIPSTSAGRNPREGLQLKINGASPGRPRSPPPAHPPQSGAVPRTRPHPSARIRRRGAARARPNHPSERPGRRTVDARHASTRARTRENKLHRSIPTLTALGPTVLTKESAACMVHFLGVTSSRAAPRRVRPSVRPSVRRSARRSVRSPPKTYRIDDLAIRKNLYSTNLPPCEK